MYRLLLDRFICLISCYMIFVLFKQLQKGGKTKLMKSDEEEELQIPKKKELKVCIKNNRQPLERLRMKDKHI